MKKSFWVAIFTFAYIVASIPNAAAADTKAPVLTSWKLIETKADISSGPAKVSVEFSVTDETFIQSPNLTLGSRSTTQSLGFATVEKIAGNDKAATFRATSTIPINSVPCPAIGPRPQSCLGARSRTAPGSDGSGPP
jgi:hypothetical protein